MTYSDNLDYLDTNFEGHDNRSAAALNTLLSMFGGKYVSLNGVVEVRVADHSANMLRMVWQINWATVTVLDDGIYYVDSNRNRKSFAFEEATMIYDYVESLWPEEVEELN